MMRAILLCAIVAYVNGQTSYTVYSTTDSTCSGTVSGVHTNYGSASCTCFATSSSGCTDGQYSSTSWVCHGNYVTQTSQDTCNSDCSSCTGSSSSSQWAQSEFAALKTGACTSSPTGYYVTVANGCDWVSGVCTEVDDSCPTDNNHTASIVVGVLGIVCLCACGIGLHMSSRTFYDGEHVKSVDAHMEDDVGPAQGDMAVVVDEVVEDTVTPDGEAVVVEENVVVEPDGEVVVEPDGEVVVEENVTAAPEGEAAVDA